MNNDQTKQQTVQAAQAALDAQPAWYKSKSTYINLLQGVVWILGVVTPLLTTAPEWVALLIGGVGTLAAAALSKLTPGEFTPSMPGRIASYMPPAPAPVEIPEGNGQYTPETPQDLPETSYVPQVQPDYDGPTYVETPAVERFADAEDTTGRHHIRENNTGGSTVVTTTASEGADYGAYMRAREG